jgi:TolA-binding protein
VKITGTLLLAGFLALVALAPSAYPQRQRSERELLNDVLLDMVRLTETVNKIQANVDSKGAKTLQLVEQIYDRFVALDSNVQRLSEAVATIRTDNEKAAGDLHQVRIAVDNLKKDVTTLGEGLTSLSTQVRSVSDKVTSLNTTVEALPTAGEMFQQAYSDYSAGFHDLAIPAFREMVTQYPADLRAPQALIYIGKSHASLKQYDLALIALDEALQKYPTSDKTCTALWEKGQTLIALKNNPEAKITLQQVVKQCPDTVEASNAGGALKGLR